MGAYFLNMLNPDPFAIVDEEHKKTVQERAALLMLCDPGTKIPGVGYRFNRGAEECLDIEIPE